MLTGRARPVIADFRYTRQMQQITSLTYADARRAIDAIQTELARRGKTGVVAVADPSGELIALARFEGAPLASILIASNKAFTAARERKPTLDIGTGLRAKNYDVAFYGDPRYVGWGGGMPVLVEGKCAGAVAVSGLSQEEDQELASLGIAAALSS